MRAIVLILALCCISAAWGEGLSIPLETTDIGYTNDVTIGTTFATKVRKINAVAKRSALAESLNLVTDGAAFAATISIGGQRFSVGLDTGSTLTAVPLTGCTQCVQNTPNSKYNPTQSGQSAIVSCTDASCTNRTFCSTAAQPQCWFNTEYMLGGITGYLYTDTLTVGSYSANVKFGAITVSENFYTAPTPNMTSPADGIMGLAYNAPGFICQPNCVTPVYDSLVAANPSLTDIFSLSYAGTSGIWTIGGIQASSNPVYYTKVIQQDFYTVEYNYISFGSHRVISDGVTLVDSGTSPLVLPRAAFQSFKNFLQSNYGNVFLVTGSQNMFDDYCYVESTKNYINQLPSVTFSFPGVDVTLPPSSYITQQRSQNQYVYCLDVIGADINYPIIGGPIFRNNIVVFDRVNNRVGFSTSIPSGATSIFAGSSLVILVAVLSLVL